MEILFFVAAIVLLAALSERFGVDSRDESQSLDPEVRNIVFERREQKGWNSRSE